VELFRGINVDWLGKKWYFLAFSLVFSVAGVLSMLFWHGIKLGIDFRGGTLVYVQFDQQPNIDRIRQSIDRAGIHDARIQTYGTSAQHQVAISLAQKETQESALDTGRQTIVQTLNANYSTTGAANQGKLDLDNASEGALTQFLVQNDPEHLASTGGAAQKYAQQAQAILAHRDKDLGGIFSSIDQLNGVADPAVVSQLKQGAYLSGFHVFAADIIGPQVGAALRKQALLATLYSLAGMLIYLWFRFELIYGVAAVVAVFHDTLITVGAFSLSNQEITLTVIAAILTLIGYSMNENLTSVVNRSINQTLSRTVLTSGLTFLTVLSLYLFGGEVLHGFSFALVIGILIGTYSSIAVAAPMLVAYQEWRGGKDKKAVLPAGKKARV
jgi:preprotein translocase subunit SecF